MNTTTYAFIYNLGGQPCDELRFARVYQKKADMIRSCLSFGFPTDFPEIELEWKPMTYDPVARYREDPNWTEVTDGKSLDYLAAHYDDRQFRRRLGVGKFADKL